MFNTKHLLLALAVATACALLNAPIASSSETNDTIRKSPAATCGNGENLKTCRGKCYAAYEKYILGDPTPGHVEQHRKELQQCYASCKASK
jgi:hypothetical protein